MQESDVTSKAEGTKDEDKSSDPAPAPASTANPDEPQVAIYIPKVERVFISASAFKVGTKAKNSRSVWLAQDRLVALGFLDAGTDNRGTYGAGTIRALTQFCGCTDEVCSVPTIDILSVLFEGVPVDITE